MCDKLNRNKTCNRKLTYGSLLQNEGLSLNSCFFCYEFCFICYVNAGEYIPMRLMRQYN